jgi:hypothetical protein
VVNDTQPLGPVKWESKMAYSLPRFGMCRRMSALKKKKKDLVGGAVWVKFSLDKALYTVKVRRTSLKWLESSGSA